MSSSDRNKYKWHHWPIPKTHSLIPERGLDINIRSITVACLLHIGVAVIMQYTGREIRTLLWSDLRRFRPYWIWKFLYSVSQIQQIDKQLNIGLLIAILLRSPLCCVPYESISEICYLSKIKLREDTLYCRRSSRRIHHHVRRTRLNSNLFYTTYKWALLWKMCSCHGWSVPISSSYFSSSSSVSL